MFPIFPGIDELKANFYNPDLYHQSLYRPVPSKSKLLINPVKLVNHPIKSSNKFLE